MEEQQDQLQEQQDQAVIPKLDIPESAPREMPAGTPTAIAQSNAGNMISSVAGTRLSTSGSTRVPFSIERPKSPCRTARM